jgi:excisionase family DNA binding protein
VLTLDEAAAFLRLPPAVVAELVRKNELPGRHVAGQWRFHRAALVDWLQGDRIAGSSAPAPVPASAPASAMVDGLAQVRGRGLAAAGEPGAPVQAAATLPEPVGEKPQARRAEEIALRDQGVLLPAGRATVEAGLSYARAERQNFGLLRVEQNTAAANLAFRYGIRDELQVSLRLPATYRRLTTDVAAALGTSERSNESYAGDLTASLLGVVARERSGRPNVIVSVDAVLPTGPGDRGLGAGVVLSKSFDPVVLFAGASYLHGFGVSDADPRRVLARRNAGFNFGYAYALNDSVALSGAFSGTYRTTPRGVGSERFGPSRESYQLQFGATMQIGPGLFLEPTVGVGVGGSAPDLTLSVNLPYTF